MDCEMVSQSSEHILRLHASRNRVYWVQFSLSKTHIIRNQELNILRWPTYDGTITHIKCINIIFLVTFALTKVVLKGKVHRASSNQLNCLMAHTPHISIKTVIRHLQCFSKWIAHFPKALLAERQFTDGVRRWRTGSALHNANLGECACDLKSWIQ